MASTVFELSIRVMAFTLTIAMALLPACADEIPCNAVTTCRIGKAKWIVNTTVTPSPYHGSKKAAYSKYEVEVRNHIAVKRLSDDMETVMSEWTSTAARCSFKETTAVDLGALLDSGEGALVTLVAGETRLTAHRDVLAARSPTFAAMLCRGSQGASNRQLRIPDVEGPVLRQLLAYLYTMQSPQLTGMAPQLLAAADMFGLSSLKSDCEAQVAAQLDVETAAATAVLAIKHSSTSLRQAAIPFIRAHWLQVITTQGWANASRSQSEYMTEVYRLLAELPVETSVQNASLGSTPGVADSQPTTDAQSSQSQTPATTTYRRPTTEAQSSQAQTPATTADSRPTTEAQSSQGQTPATTASPAPPCPTPPPGDAAVSRLRSLASAEKGRRLIEAAKVGRLEEVEALLAAGADVGARDGGGMTALHHAAVSGHVGVARCLVGCGAEVDARGNWYQTPLHWAAWNGHAAVVRLLAASGDHSARNLWGWTPLHMAVNNDHTEAVAALVKAGADKEARNISGQTPLALARILNRQKSITLLT